MNKTEGLRAGIAELRSVAQRLMEWEKGVHAGIEVMRSMAQQLPEWAEGLIAGIAEMRSVAQRLPEWAERLYAGTAEMRPVAERLMTWAGDLEASFRNQEANEPEVSASGSGTAEKEKKKPEQAGDQPAAVKKAGKALTLPEVRAILAEKVAAGFGTQVKALIESYGAVSLKEVPADRYGELLEAAGQLGGDADAG